MPVKDDIARGRSSLLENQREGIAGLSKALGRPDKGAPAKPRQEARSRRRYAPGTNFAPRALRGRRRVWPEGGSGTRFVGTASLGESQSENDQNHRHMGGKESDAACEVVKGFLMFSNIDLPDVLLLHFDCPPLARSGIRAGANRRSWGA
jgi:hypothetical protein